MKALFTTLAAAAMLALPLAPARADTAPPVPQLQANGTGEVKVVPDIAIVTLGVTTRGETAAGALAENSTDLDKVIAAIGAAGVASKDIATTGLSVNPVYENRSQPSDQPAKIVGYEVSNQIRVIVRDTAGSAAIIDKVVQSGANQIYGIGFDVEDRTDADREGDPRGDRRGARQGRADGRGGGRPPGAHPHHQRRRELRRPVADAGARLLRGVEGAGDARRADDLGQRADQLGDRAEIAPTPSPFRGGMARPAQKSSSGRAKSGASARSRSASRRFSRFSSKQGAPGAMQVSAAAQVSRPQRESFQQAKRLATTRRSAISSGSGPGSSGRGGVRGQNSACGDGP